MSLDRKALVFRFIPRVHAALIVQPGLCLRCIVGEDGKRRNAVFAVVLKLVVSPDNAEVRLELIERSARPAKTVDHCLAMLVRMRLPFIGSPLLAHRLWPVIETPQRLGQRRVRQTYFNTAR